MSEGKAITFYTTKEIKEGIEQHADEEGTSVSSWVEQVVEQKLADETLEQAADAVGLEDRMNRLLGRTEDRVDVLLRDSLASESVDAVYSRAVWELISTEYGAKERKDALETAVEHVEEKTDETVEIDPDQLVDTTTDTQSNSASGTSQSSDSNDDHWAI